RFLGIVLTLAAVPAVSAGEPERQLEFLGTLKGGRPRGLSNVAFSASGTILASSDEPLDDGPAVVKLWDVKERMAIATLRGVAGAGDAVALSADGKTLAAGGADVTLWDLATQKEKASFRGGAMPGKSVCPWRSVPTARPSPRRTPTGPCGC